MREVFIEAIEKYMESKTMRDYLVENVDTLEKWQIVDLICGARADLRDKYETLKSLPLWRVRAIGRTDIHHLRLQEWQKRHLMSLY